MMSPCELNVLITGITNYLFCNLTKEEFRCLNVFISELSKSMFATTLFQEICPRKEEHKNQEKQNEKKEKQ